MLLITTRLADYVSGSGGTGIKYGRDGGYLAHHENEIPALLNKIDKKVVQFNAAEGHLGTLYLQQDAEVHIWAFIQKD